MRKRYCLYLIVLFSLSGSFVAQGQNIFNREFGPPRNPDGHYIKPGDKGKTSKEFTVINGALADTFFWYKNRMPEQVYPFLDGHFEGNILRYDDRGRLTDVESFRRDTLIYTAFYKYYPNDSVKNHYIIYAGQRNIFPFAQYSSVKDGWINMQTDTYMESIASHGKDMFYYANGKVKEEYDVINYKYTGVYKVYYPDGKLKIESGMADGKYNGDYKEFYPDGQLKIVSGILNNKYDGPYKEYYANGKIQLDGYFKKGKFHGTEHEYDKNGTLRKSKTIRH